MDNHKFALEQAMDARDRIANIIDVLESDKPDESGDCETETVMGAIDAIRKSTIKMYVGDGFVIMSAFTYAEMKFMADGYSVKEGQEEIRRE